MNPDSRNPEVSNGQFAEGKRELRRCGCCGSPIVRVYHGARSNHTVEPLVSPLSDEEQRFYEDCRRSIVEARNG